MSGFWKKGYKDQLGVLKAEEKRVLASLKEVLHTSTDRDEKRDLKARVKEVKVEYWRKRRALHGALFAGG